MSKLQDGQKYPGRPTGVASVYENDKGSLVLCAEIDVQGETLRYYAAIATEKDGINTKTVNQLKTIFGWDGLDPFWFVDNGQDYAEREIEVTIELRQGTTNPDKWFPSIKYIDPPGGSGGQADMPQTGDRNGLLAKYGSKFRAIAGGAAPAPAKPKAKAEVPPTKAKAPPTKAPPDKPVRTSFQMEVWQKYCALGGEDDKWFTTIAEAVPGVDQGDLTPEQWGKVLDHIESTFLPM